ncbi:alpha-glucan family phosphorylase [Ammoniphilus resinae]|uniref:Starch phosphorylase n=1 Tax=Ammoniphilus resinae TaxID=861532 RepID=A0ABS4GUL3_9BACL|nr:alpha-glucan family phosphorylase [Ammoniphilus resinae]MBP1933958.1 starch phosphorylase [Ammoniphilus resinae]
MEAKIAYFSAEFGIDSSLPIYSGGLGVLAGDHIKAANDLKIPLVGVGIFYRRGYFEQRILSDGTQQAHYPLLDPEQLPLQRARDNQGKRLEVVVPIANRQVFLHVWVTHVGMIPVYLLDADHERNREADRRLTDALYGGNEETRISQEIILGIGGVRALRKIGFAPDVWHMNEGHSAFLNLERIREYSAAGISFETALEAVKASTIFTTHTPVPAGHDHFSFEVMDRFFGDYYWQLGTSRETILSLGRIGNRFNLTRLAVQTSSKVNGVSKLHAEVTKQLFHHWTPHIPAQHIPVEAITNGVHTMTWLAPELKALFDRYLDVRWSKQVADVRIWRKVLAIPDQELWQAHQAAKKRMLAALGLPAELQDMLVIGFARRFATYKRALLVFRDLERIRKLVQHTDRPVCFIFAGKAHPADRPGQEILRKIVQWSQSPEFAGRIFFVENYQMEIAKHLVQGVDVWLNTPIKPMEASGTSGQKSGINGVLNCSILDGWWIEGYNGRNGWAIEGEGLYQEQDCQDEADSRSLYQMLEEQIIPLFYAREKAIPVQWVSMMKESIRSLTPVFSTSCMVSEYWAKLYIPAAIRGRRFVENGLEVAARVAVYKQFIRENWKHVRVDEINLKGAGQTGAQVQLSTAEAGLGLAAESIVQAVVRLGPVWCQDVRVEAVGSDGQGGVWKQELQHIKEMESGLHLFAGTYHGSQEKWIEDHANIRVIPISPDFSHDFEMELAIWGLAIGWLTRKVNG